MHKTTNTYYLSVSVGEEPWHSLVILSLSGSQATVRAPARAAVFSKFHKGGWSSRLTHMAVGQPQVLTVSWLETSVP